MRSINEEHLQYQRGCAVLVRPLPLLLMLLANTVHPH